MYLSLVFFFILGTHSAVIINTIEKGRFSYVKPTSEENLLGENHKYWYDLGGAVLERNIKHAQEQQRHVAKNIVIFVGDGMGISTITAGRIYKGQRNGKSGEDHNMVFDTFPNVGLVKTYNVDMQVPDSAATATALFTGCKTRYETLGLDVTATKTFNNATFESSKLESIMTWAQRVNKDTGIITTTRITHATPAATYAHVNHRNWECDSKIPSAAKPYVKDISRQLIEDAPGKNFKVILGGGFQQLGHINEDLSYEKECLRSDGLNLTQLWIEKHKDLKAAFVIDNQGLDQVTSETDYLLGLFHPDHLPYNLIRNKGPKGSPSLAQMTQKGLDILKKGPEGFVLMVEGGRIDHGHHKNYARMAMEETSELDEAISLVLRETGPDTLVIVTADHSHAMTLNGYSYRGNDILGFGIDSGNLEKKPALTLTYANGPGFNYHYSPNETSVLGPWRDVRTDPNLLNDPKYQHLGSFEVTDESHGGEDVGIFAVGPSSHLVRGVMEQNYVAHLVSYAGCFGPRAGMNPYCDGKLEEASSYGTRLVSTWIGYVLVIMLFCDHIV